MKYTFITLALLVTIGCAKDPERNDGGASGTSGSAGSGGGGSGGSAGSFVIGPSGLPIPPAPTNVPQPSGTPGNLKVVNWAGFKSAVTYTFDDAQPSQIEHYAELQATGAHFTFYITSGQLPVPAWASWNIVAGFGIAIVGFLMTTRWRS